MSKRIGLAVVLLAVATLVASESNSLAGHRQRRGCANGSCGTTACAAPACGSCGTACDATAATAAAAAPAAPAPVASAAPKAAEPAKVVEAAPAKATYTYSAARRRGLFRRG